MQTEYLSWAQKNKISNQKDVYVVLRSIMFLKICQGVDRVDDQTFKLQLAKLKKKYKLFTSMIPNFDINKFCKQFKVPQEQIQGAISQLQISSSDQDQKLSGFQLWMSITALFIQVADLCSLNVGQVKLLLNKLLNRLNSICLQFKSSQLNEKVKILQKLVDEFIGLKTVDQQLTEVQIKEIQLEVQGLYDFLFDITGRPKSQKKNQ